MKGLKYFDTHRRATWLELFFDLIFVVALHDAGEILSETRDGHIAPQQFLHFVLVFLPLWWIWAATRSTPIASTPTAASTGCRPC
jgi:low temperature requirement protein LtrA